MQEPNEATPCPHCDGAGYFEEDCMAADNLHTTRIVQCECTRWIYIPARTAAAALGIEPNGEDIDVLTGKRFENE